MKKPKTPKEVKPSSGPSPNPYNWQNCQPKPVIGVDEVGRGCLAGPVYAAAVIINNRKEHPYTDSKVLSAKRREQLRNHIIENHSWAIGIASVEEITRYNILNAALLAMKRAVLKLDVEGGTLLVDGKQKVPGMDSFSQVTLIKGDLRATPIAAASIVAKVARDGWISAKGSEYPEYGFERHKGYSTKDHKQAIAKWGPCELHRPTFAGVKEFL